MCGSVMWHLPTSQLWNHNLASPASWKSHRNSWPWDHVELYNLIIEDITWKVPFAQEKLIVESNTFLKCAVCSTYTHSIVTCGYAINWITTSKFKWWLQWHLSQKKRGITLPNIPFENKEIRKIKCRCTWSTQRSICWDMKSLVPFI